MVRNVNANALPEPTSTWRRTRHKRSLRPSGLAYHVSSVEYQQTYTHIHQHFFFLSFFLFSLVLFSFHYFLLLMLLTSAPNPIINSVQDWISILRFHLIVAVVRFLVFFFSGCRVECYSIERVPQCNAF